MALFNQIFPATIAKLQANLNFTKPNADSLSLTTKINLSSFTNVIQLTGASLVVNVGDVKMPFTLDNKGRSIGANGACRLAYTKPTRTKMGFWTLTATYGKGNWRAQWANYGLDNASHKSPGAVVTLPVMVLVGNKIFIAEPTLHYTATMNKTGLAK